MTFGHDNVLSLCKSLNKFYAFGILSHLWQAKNHPIGKGDVTVIMYGAMVWDDIALPLIFYHQDFLPDKSEKDQVLLGCKDTHLY